MSELEQQPATPATPAAMAPPANGFLHEDPVIHGRRWFLLAIMCLSLVMVVMSVAGMNVTVPSIQQDLDASDTQLLWIVASYGLVFAALLLPAGALGDRFGRKRALLCGLTVFAVGSTIAGLGSDAAQVIIGRAITGIGAAFVMPATLSLITTIFPPEERRRAIAIWAGFAGAGGALGLIVSGALLEGFWWGSAVLVNVPVVAVVLIAVSVFAPEAKDPNATPLDPFGAALSFTGLGSLVYGIIEGPERGWTDPLVLLAFTAAVILLVSFVLWERRAKHPMLPLWLFRDRRLSVGAGVITSSFFVMFGLFLLFSLYLQFVRGYSPLLAGLATVPLALTLIAIAPRSALLAEKFGTGNVVSSGFLLISAGFAVLAFVTPTTAYPVIAVALVLLGGGMSLTAAPSTGSIMSAVPAFKAGVGSAINDTTREVGGALGIAVLGSIANAAYRSTLHGASLNLPPDAAKAVRRSIGNAIYVSHQVPDGQALAHKAGQAFTDAFSLATAVSAIFALAGAIVVKSVFSRRAEDAAVAEAEAVIEAAAAAGEPALAPTEI